MPTRCNRGFLLQILLLAQHVSGTTMPIIRSSRVLYSGCRLWHFVLWFSSCCSGVELRVMCLVCSGISCCGFQAAVLVWSWGLSVQFAECCSILQTRHITLSSTPEQQIENYSMKCHRWQPLYNTLELLMMGIVVPETCWASNKICNKKPLLHLFGILFPHLSYYYQQHCAIFSSVSATLHVLHTLHQLPISCLHVVPFTCKNQMTLCSSTFHHISLLPSWNCTVVWHANDMKGGLHGPVTWWNPQLGKILNMKHAPTLFLKLSFSFINPGRDFIILLLFVLK